MQNFTFKKFLFLYSFIFLFFFSLQIRAQFPASGITICKGGSGELTVDETIGESVANSVTSFLGHWNSETDPIAPTLFTGMQNSTTCRFTYTKRNYTSANFTVSTSGIYSFKMTENDQYDGAAYIYSGNFTPGDCSAGGNWIIGDDDTDGDYSEPRMTAFFNAGVTYTLISTLWSNRPGVYMGDYTWTVTPPNGGLFLLETLYYWYTTSTGGNPIGWGNSFNPIGVNGSGLLDTNTAGTTTYYVSDGTEDALRTAVNFVINEDNTVSPPSSKPTLCINTVLTSITHTTTGATGIGTVTELPAGVTAAWASDKITISGTPTESGVFQYTIPLTGGCGTANATGKITVNPLPTATIQGTTTVCKNATAPQIAFTAADGKTPYTFTYKINGGTSQTATTLLNSNEVKVEVPTNTAGTFIYELVSVKDASDTSCEQTQSGTATITVNPLPTATIQGTTSVCKDATAPKITFTAADGKAPYTFTYKINGGTSQTATALSNSNEVKVEVPTNTAGTFIYELVSVKDASDTSCEQTQSGTATITVNPLPTATIQGTTSVCKDATAPKITFTAADGKAPYTFTYKINGGTSQTATTLLNSNEVKVEVPTNTAGTFSYELVSVKDASDTSCEQTQSGTATITVNLLPTATIQGTTSVCKDATAPKITFTAADGKAPYTFTYKINNGTEQTATTLSNSNEVKVDAPTNTAGTFSYELVSVKDASDTSCEQTQSGTATITVNLLPTATIQGTTSVCKDATAPKITFTAAAGKAPYTFTYKINNGTEQTATTLSNSNEVKVDAPTNTAGTFSYELVSVKDASDTSCEQTQSGTATITVNLLPTATIQGTTSVCKDATAPKITFTAAAGKAPYTFTYKINNGTEQTATALSNSNEAKVEVPTNTAGTFAYELVSVKDANDTSCEQTQSGTATITVNPLPTATIQGTTSVCKDATAPKITFTAAAGKAPYIFTYKINNGTEQTATTLSNSNEVKVEVPTNTAGTFIYELVSVKDANDTSCEQAQSGTATITVNPLPTAPTLSAVTQPTCVTTTGSFIITNYDDLYTYTITPVTGVYRNGNTVTAPKGKYQITATLGTCTSLLSEKAVINKQLTTPDKPTLSSVNQPSCDNATGSFTITNYDNLYTYTITPVTGVVQNGEKVTAPIGEYIIRANNGDCQSDLENILIKAPTSLSASLVANSLIPESCLGEENGAFTIEITGGNKPYNYNLDNKNDPFSEGSSEQTEFIFTELSAGKHIVNIKDASGCITEVEVILPNTIVINPIANINYLCINDAPTNSVTITVDPSLTDSSDLDYSLDGIIYQSDKTFTNVASGTHIIYTRHTNGCIQPTREFFIDYIEPLTLKLADGELNQIVAAATGGVGNYRYSFEGESYSNDNKFTIYKSGDYTVTVTDKNGCSTTATKYFDYIDVCIPNHFTPNGDGINDEWGPGCTVNYKNLTFTIFDRYGRIIGNFKYGQKWDGKYNGTELTSGDYWYVFKLNDNKDNREFVGHFTLYR